MMFVAVL